LGLRDFVGSAGGFAHHSLLFDCLFFGWWWLIFVVGFNCDIELWFLTV
jgi:hypothetical protein